MHAGKRIKATGNCFDNCGRHLLSNALSEMTLVHCTVTGTGDKVKGIDYSHAFLITEDGRHALDMTNSEVEPTIVPLDVYRHLGNVKNEIHYSRGAALAEMTRTGHYGAWDDSVITDADRNSIQRRGPKGKRWS